MICLWCLDSAELHSLCHLEAFRSLDDLQEHEGRKMSLSSSLCSTRTRAGLDPPRGTLMTLIRSRLKMTRVTRDWFRSYLLTIENAFLVVVLRLFSPWSFGVCPGLRNGWSEAPQGSVTEVLSPSQRPVWKRKPPRKLQVQSLTLLSPYRWWTWRLG